MVTIVDRTQKTNAKTTRNAESGAVIYGILAAGVYQTHMEHIYDVAFRQGMPVKEAAQRAISDQEDPEKVDVTVYKFEDWRANKEINEFAEQSTLNVAIHIDGETQMDITFLRRKEMETNVFFWKRVLESIALIDSGCTPSLTRAKLEI